MLDTTFNHLAMMLVEHDVIDRGAEIGVIVPDIEKLYAKFDTHRWPHDAPQYLSHWKTRQFVFYTPNCTFRFREAEKLKFKEIEDSCKKMSFDMVCYREKMAAAFLQETGLNPVDVVMIQRYVQGGIEISFRPKTVEEMGDM